jgi:putative acetyltransferase
MDVITRKADSNDLPEILELFVDCVHIVCKKDYEKDQRAAWASAANSSKWWLDKIDNQYFIVAEKANRIIGFTALAGNDTVDLLYVHKDFQNIGIASLLLNSILDRVKIAGCYKLRAEVSKTARPFFEKKGFSDATEQTKIIQGIAIETYQMLKIL